MKPAKPYKIIIFLFFLLTQIVLGQTLELKGLVTDSQKLPLPGASIIAKGTSIGTTSDFDGEFVLKIPDSVNTIVISMLGFETKEIDISKSSNTNKTYILEEDVIELKEIVTVCKFYPHHIGLHYFGGINYSRLGFLVEYFDPYALRLPFIPEIKFGYQTNSEKNHQTIAEFNLKDIFRISRKYFDINTSFNEIALENGFYWKSLQLEFETNFKTFRNRYTTFSLGIGQSNLNSKESFGIITGFKQYLFKRIWVNSKLANWGKQWQLITGVTWGYKNISVFYQFNAIETYSDHNLGVGYYINI